MINKFNVGDVVYRSSNFGEYCSEIKAGFVGRIAAIDERRLIQFDRSIKSDRFTWFDPQYYELYVNTKESQPEDQNSPDTGLSLVKRNNALVLAYNGDILPYQNSLYINSRPNEIGTITVEFMTNGLTNIDEVQYD